LEKVGPWGIVLKSYVLSWVPSPVSAFWSPHIPAAMMLLPHLSSKAMGKGNPRLKPLKARINLSSFQLSPQLFVTAPSNLLT
jgi:hypothetical protein